MNAEVTIWLLAIGQVFKDTAKAVCYMAYGLGFAAGMVLENCRRMNVTGCSLLDCDSIGLLLKNVTDSRVSGCLIRNDSPEAGSWTALKMIGGHGNMVVNNLLGDSPRDALLRSD